MKEESISNSVSAREKRFQGSLALTASLKKELGVEVDRRKKAEKDLKTQKDTFREEVKNWEKMKVALRGFSRQILSAQDEERKKISRDLHDVVVQALTAINVRLAILNREASIRSKSFGQSISATQKAVKASALLVHQFARQLSPLVLDDLGLLPALQAYVKGFSAHFGLPVRLTVYAGSKTLPPDQRTALYRIAQEGLSNVARHAQADSASVVIGKVAGAIQMTIQDDGVGFDVARMFPVYGGHRLGLLGMQERVEMVGGTFEVKSSPRRGTLLTIRLPEMPILTGKRIKEIR